MKNNYSEQYGDDPIISVLGTKKFMFIAWLMFTASAGITALWLGGRIGANGHLALQVLFVEGLVAVFFGLYRSLFYNFLCGLSAVVALVLSVAAFLGGNMEGLSIGMSMLALLMGCYAITGVFIVFSMVAQSWSEKQKTACGAAR
jgi:hypothetical protein